MNKHDTIVAFFLKSADKYLQGWQENKTPPFPLMQMLKQNKDDNEYSTAYVPLEIPGGIPDGVDPMILVKPILESFTPDAYIIMAEAWTVRADKLEKSIANLRVGDMEYMKSREEKLIIYGNSKDDRVHFTEIYLIKRDHRTNKKWLVSDPKMKVFSSKLP